MLVIPMEPNNCAYNQPYMTIRTEDIETPQALKTPVMQEFITFTTLYNTGANRNHPRVRRTDINGSNLVGSGSVTGSLAICTSPTPPFFCICNGRIGNIGQTSTPNFSETREFHTSIDRRLSNDSNGPSIGSQILCN